MDTTKNDYQMKDFRIKSPCKENWNLMSATENGAICQKCSTEVHDFTRKTNDEIRMVLRDNIGNSICSRYKNEQFESLNADFEAWQYKSQRTVQRAMLFSLIMVFGLNLFSCNSPKEEEALKQVQLTLSEMSVATNSFASEASLKEKQIEIKVAKIEHKGAKVSVDEIYNVELMRDIEISKVNVVKNVNPTESVRYFTYSKGMSISSVRYDEYLIQSELLPVESNLIELDENGREFPIAFDSKVFPNPVAELASLELKLPIKQEMATIALYDMKGSYLQSIHEGMIDRGTYNYELNLIDLKPGVYLIIINSNGYKKTLRFNKI